MLSAGTKGVDGVVWVNRAVRVVGGVLSAGTKGVDGIVWVNRTVRGGVVCCSFMCCRFVSAQWKERV